MTTETSASGRWTDEQVRELRRLIKENTPTRVIALKLQRTPKAVQSKVRALGLSLKPANQAPYG